MKKLQKKTQSSDMYKDTIIKKNKAHLYIFETQKHETKLVYVELFVYLGS